jgi:uncharacterized integral membrane protein
VFRRLGADEYQGRLWAMLIGLFLLALYVIAFISKNDRRIEIDFVLFTATVSLIWLIVLILAVGVLGGVLLSQLYRRRRGRRERSKPRAGDGELGGRREAEGQPGG